MPSSRKIYVVDNNSDLSNWMQGNMVNDMAKADVVVFPGGQDISPSIYGDKVHPKTNAGHAIDKWHTAEFKKAHDLGKKMVGICRGAQLLCALSGGKLVQDQEDKYMAHPFLTYDGKDLVVNSLHHQAMYPWMMPEEEYAVLGWSVGLSKHHEDGSRTEIVNGVAPLNMEVEAAFFKKFNALCIQCHPEMMYHHKDSNPIYRESLAYFRQLLSIFLEGHDFKEAHRAYSC